MIDWYHSNCFFSKLPWGFNSGEEIQTNLRRRKKEMVDFIGSQNSRAQGWVQLRGSSAPEVRQCHLAFASLALSPSLQEAGVTLSAHPTETQLKEHLPPYPCLPKRHKVPRKTLKTWPGSWIHPTPVVAGAREEGHLLVISRMGSSQEMGIFL